MKAFTQLNGLVCPLDRANVDTDAIIPKQFLKSIKRSGFGPYLFDEWRYTNYGEPGMDCTNRPRNPDFVLNQPRYQGAQVLLARDNFGCGSSREHAPWAIEDYGFRVIIAPSFADIFFSNCYKNAVLPIVASEEIVDRLSHGPHLLLGHLQNGARILLLAHRRAHFHGPSPRRFAVAVRAMDPDRDGSILPIQPPPEHKDARPFRLLPDIEASDFTILQPDLILPALDVALLQRGLADGHFDRSAHAPEGRCTVGALQG